MGFSPRSFSLLAPLGITLLGIAVLGTVACDRSSPGQLFDKPEAAQFEPAPLRPEIEPTESSARVVAASPKKSDSPPESATTAPGANGSSALPTSSAQLPPRPSSAQSAPVRPNTPQPHTTASSQSEPPPKTVRGPAATGDNFTAYLQTSGRYVVGQPGAIVAVVSAKGDFKCNDKYPTKFAVTSSSGVSFASKIVGGSLVGKQGALTIPLSVQSSGPASVSGVLQFSVCSATRCELEKRDLTIAFEIP